VQVRAACAAKRVAQVQHETGKTVSSVPIERVQRSQLIDEVAMQLLQLIRDGVYAPGDRLPPIRELVTNLGVSVTTVREALRKLESLGLIRIEHGSGTYVSDTALIPLLVRPIPVSDELDAKILKDLLAVRRLLERGAAELAAQHASAEQVAHLEEIYREMERHLHDPLRFSQANTEFHLYISDMSGNAILPLLLSAVRELIIRHQQRLNASEEVRRRSLRYHHAILSAIRDRDAERAGAQMGAHLDDVMGAYDRPVS
jgi:GntR family transcriptional repressor for pyruvate dehydrogenase complex